MAKPFPVPWTLADENEFGVFSWYVTVQELGLVVLGTMASYLCLAPIVGTGLVNIVLTLVAAASLMQLVISTKKGKPASWLWDLRLGVGMLPNQRGLMQAHRGVRWLSQQHVARPCIFLAGCRSVGDDLTVSTPWMQALPPATDWSPLMLPRRRRVFVRQPSSAPAWFLVADGCSSVVTPKIPLSVQTIVVPWPGHA